MMRHGIRHGLQLGATATLALACFFYAFMPGTHDRLAVTISIMTQMMGWTGLLMVPIGIAWLVCEVAVIRARRQGSLVRKDKRHRLAFGAIAASPVVAAGVALAALIQTGPSLAAAVLILWAYIVRRCLLAVKRMKVDDDARFNPAPLYIIVIPCLLVTAHLMWLAPAVEFSRTRTIAGGARFISAIEAYGATHGRYPLSLASVHHDYDPPIVGVERYHYEPQGEAYNVFFEQLTFPIGTREFVMFNPLDQHAMIVHNQDTLESPQEQVDRERRFHARAAHDAGVSRWK